jgi:hypothetical protein
MRGSAESTLIRTSTAGDQRSDWTSSESCPLIMIHGNEMSGWKREAIKILNEGPGRGSDNFSIQQEADPPDGMQFTILFL